MSEFFQEHKRTLAVGAVVAVVFLIASGLINDHYGTEIQRANTEIQRAELDSRRFRVDPQQVASVRAARDGAAQRVADLTRRLHRGEEEGFALVPSITDADLHYNRMADLVRRNELERCAVANIHTDMSLGLPDTFPTTRREIDWYLRGLDIVKQVLGMLLDINAQVLEGGIARVDRIEIDPAPKARKDNAPVPMIGRVGVSFTIVGHPQAMGALRERLARPQAGRALALLQGTERSLDLPPGSGPKSTRGMDPLDLGRTQMVLKVAALSVDAGTAGAEK